MSNLLDATVMSGAGVLHTWRMVSRLTRFAGNDPGPGDSFLAGGSQEMRHKMMAMNKSDLYDKDFFCWTVENAALLREGKAEQADLEHIAQEIEDMGKRDYREVSSMLRVLIAHLLKWRFQPELRSRSWRDTINALRLELDAIFEDSASLLNKAREDLARIYRKAVRQARNETELPTTAFPPECPFVLDQILDDQFFPDPTHA